MNLGLAPPLLFQFLLKIFTKFKSTLQYTWTLPKISFTWNIYFLKLDSVVRELTGNGVLASQTAGYPVEAGGWVLFKL